MQHIFSYDAMISILYTFSLCGAVTIYAYIIMQVDMMLRDYKELQIVLPVEFITTTIEASKRFYFIYIIYTHTQWLSA